MTALLLPLGGLAAEYVDVPGATIRSVVASDATNGMTTVEPFHMRTLPVSRAEFANFVTTHPQWQPGKVPRVFADASYLSDWPADWAKVLAGGMAADSTTDLINGLAADQATERRTTSAAKLRPVTWVSWFAAQAFCESEGARLPTWNEWELAAAADSTRRDARDDPAWRARILSWYARPATVPLPSVGGEANAYGVRDLHGLVWEWVDDFNALLVNGDSRSADDPDKLRFCGAGAINLQQRDHYAVLMRVALLSSLKASDSTASLGFRCVRPHLENTP